MWGRKKKESPDEARMREYYKKRADEFFKVTLNAERILDEYSKKYGLKHDDDILAPSFDKGIKE